MSERSYIETEAEMDAPRSLNTRIEQEQHRVDGAQWDRYQEPEYREANEVVLQEEQAYADAHGAQERAELAVLGAQYGETPNLPATEAGAVYA